MPLYIINIPRCKDRRNHMERLCRDHALECRWIEGIGGKSLKDRELKAKYGDDILSKREHLKGRSLTKAEIGCVLSHLSAYQAILSQNPKIACILEDDVLFPDHFKTLLQSIAVAVEQWDLLLLGHWSYPMPNREKGARGKAFGVNLAPINKVTYKLTEPIEFPFSATGYCITQAAAKKMINYVFPIKAPIDWYTGSSGSMLKLRILSPPCVLPDFSFKSTMTERPISMCHKPKRSWMRQHLHNLLRGMIHSVSNVNLLPKKYGLRKNRFYYFSFNNVPKK